MTNSKPIFNKDGQKVKELSVSHDKGSPLKLDQLPVDKVLTVTYQDGFVHRGDTLPDTCDLLSVEVKPVEKIDSRFSLNGIAKQISGSYKGPLICNRKLTLNKLTVTNKNPQFKEIITDELELHHSSFFYDLISFNRLKFLTGKVALDFLSSNKVKDICDVKVMSVSDLSGVKLAQLVHIITSQYNLVDVNAPPPKDEQKPKCYSRYPLICRSDRQLMKEAE